MQTSPTGRAFVGAQTLVFVAFFALPRIWAGGWEPGVGTVIGWALVALGAGLAVAAGVALGRNLTPFPEPRGGAELVTAGPYRHVRHPIYGGVLLAAAGWTLVTGSLAAALVAACMLALFDAKRRYEERVLLERFDEYAAYRDRTSAFVPFLF